MVPFSTAVLCQAENCLTPVLLVGVDEPSQVGIKYGGKGEVDVGGLEMELREPYKVLEGRIPSGRITALG